MKHKAFLLIMSHSLRAGPGQGVSEVQSVTHKVAGGFGLLIKGDLICSGYCRGKKKMSQPPHRLKVNWKWEGPCLTQRMGPH